jgi:hypothetical protein
MGAVHGLTNLANLPDAIVAAVANDSYSKGDGVDISVTGILKPPRQVVLETRHHDAITQDVSERVWSLLGQSVHTILERANRRGIAERRLYIACEGWTISGGMDLYDEEGVLSDYKITSSHKLVQGNLDDWVSQLNLYSAILRHHGHAVSKLQVIAILRDWSKLQARRDPNYPQAQVVNVPIALWDHTRALEFMRTRVRLHQQARISLPECTAEERWAKPDQWAVMKQGRKSAVKLYSNPDEAMDHAVTHKDLVVMHRRGESIRCAEYCAVSPFCDQWKQLKQLKQPTQGE